MAKSIGSILVEKKLVKPEELSLALAQQEKNGDAVGRPSSNWGLSPRFSCCSLIQSS